MNGRIVPLVLVLVYQFSADSFACTKFLNHIRTQADFYYSLGRSDNFIKHKMLPGPLSDANDQISEIYACKNKDELIDALAQCVFLYPGVERDHLSEVSSKILAKRLSDHIHGWWEHRTGRYFKVDDQSMLSKAGMINAECGVAVEHDGRVLMMQGIAPKESMTKYSKKKSHENSPAR